MKKKRKSSVPQKHTRIITVQRSKVKGFASGVHDVVALGSSRKPPMRSPALFERRVVTHTKHTCKMRMRMCCLPHPLGSEVAGQLTAMQGGGRDGEPGRPMLLRTPGTTELTAALALLWLLLFLTSPEHKLPALAQCRMPHTIRAEHTKSKYKSDCHEKTEGGVPGVLMESYSKYCRCSSKNQGRCSSHAGSQDVSVSKVITVRLPACTVLKACPFTPK